MTVRRTGVLTEEQRRRVREQTGTDAEAIEFEAEELEERIAPFRPLSEFGGEGAL